MTAGRWSMKLPRNAALAEKDVMLRWRCCVQHDVYARGSETCVARAAWRTTECSIVLVLPCMPTRLVRDSAGECLPSAE